MEALEWVTVIFAILTVVIYVGDSFYVFFRHFKEAIADKKLTKEELDVLEADARLVVKGFLKLIGMIRKV